MAINQSIYQCPKGHKSTESDYCSECGARIFGNPGEESSTLGANNINNNINHKVNGNIINCPACGADHDPDSGNFCEICGYDFTSGKVGEYLGADVDLIAIAPNNDNIINPSNTNPSDINPSISTSPNISTKIQLIITIDPSLSQPDSPEAPVNQPPINLHLTKESNLIGRTSQLKGIFPEIALDFDDAISRRHALLNITPDGMLILRDIGSANGTRLNGVELKSMVDVSVKVGDEITLGHWTRIQIQSL
jgi:FHA domain